MRRRMMLNQDDGKTRYGGIVCAKDNFRYNHTNGLVLENGYESQECFVAAIVDKGSNRRQTITWGYTDDAQLPPNISPPYTMREYTDLSQTSYDYWGLYHPTTEVSFYGRYLSFVVLKDKAQYFFVQIKETGEYLLKGDAV